MSIHVDVCRPRFGPMSKLVVIWRFVAKSMSRRGVSKKVCDSGPWPPPPGITHAQKIRKYNFHAKGFHGTGFFFPIDWNSFIANVEINKKITNGTWNNFRHRQISLPVGSLGVKFHCILFWGLFLAIFSIPYHLHLHYLARFCSWIQMLESSMEQAWAPKGTLEP